MAFGRLWAAWKGGDNPHDADHTQNKLVFIATAAELLGRPNPTGEPHDPDALCFLRDTRQHVLDLARRLCTDQADVSGALRVHRGLYGRGAVELRLQWLETGSVPPHMDHPSSYSGPPAAAVRFSQKGPTWGFHYAIDVFDDEVVYVDDSALWSLEGLEGEDEVVVWPRDNFRSFRVIEELRNPGAVTHKHRTAKSDYIQLGQQLLAEEQERRVEIGAPAITDENIDGLPEGIAESRGRR